jgi:nucleotide-binding universal stress UspA family protein
MSQENAVTILVPVDYSDQSIIALEQAVELSKAFHSKIHILNVIAGDHSIRKLFRDEVKEAELEKNVKVKLEALATATAEKYDVEISHGVAHGKIYDQIVNAANVLDSSFIVMGTNGSVGLKGRFIGSNALRVVRESKIPVITIKGKSHRKGCQNIVLPLDLTKETKEKVARAVDFAKMFGSTIRVVSVLLTNDEFIVNRLTRQLDQVKKYLGSQGVDSTAEIIKDTKGGGSLAEGIIDYSGKCKGDLIMIMTQQEGDSSDYFIGSTSQGIINNSDIPVLSIIPSVKKDTSVFNPY